MNPELTFQLMQSDAKELRQAAARHRRAAEAAQDNRAERRTVFGVLRRTR
ncbi:hypothetical protein [Nonomuraea longicatena]|uniref:Uncharacterized protein n=1 Tax=Nonomuraea longicatena TaxID=83682 RepID=A0ABN1Q778_9ACTN